MDAGATVLCVVGGLLVGDALEVPVERLGAHRPFDRPWWRCPHCQTADAGLALVPLVRVAARRRPCGACGSTRPWAWRPLVLAAVTAVAAGLIAARFGATAVLPAYLVFAVGLVAASAVDVERSIIPNRMVYPTAGAVAVLLVVAAAVDGPWSALGHAVIGSAAAVALFGAVHLVSPRGMGLGDVRLAGVIGLAVGWLGVGHLFVAFFVAVLAGSLWGIGLMVVSGRGRKTRLPFGPFLALGGIVAVVWGNPLSNALLHRAAA